MNVMTQDIKVSVLRVTGSEKNVDIVLPVRSRADCYEAAWVPKFCGKYKISAQLVQEASSHELHGSPLYVDINEGPAYGPKSSLIKAPKRYISNKENTLEIVGKDVNGNKVSIETSEVELETNGAIELIHMRNNLRGTVIVEFTTSSGLGSATIRSTFYYFFDLPSFSLRS